MVIHMISADKCLITRSSVFRSTAFNCKQFFIKIQLYKLTTLIKFNLHTWSIHNCFDDFSRPRKSLPAYFISLFLEASLTEHIDNWGATKNRELEGTAAGFNVCPTFGTVPKQLEQLSAFNQEESIHDGRVHRRLS